MIPPIAPAATLPKIPLPRLLLVLLVVAPASLVLVACAGLNFVAISAGKVTINSSASISFSCCLSSSKCPFMIVHKLCSPLCKHFSTLLPFKLISIGTPVLSSRYACSFQGIASTLYTVPPAVTSNVIFVIFTGTSLRKFCPLSVTIISPSSS